MTPEELNRALLIERFGKAVREWHPAWVDEHAAHERIQIVEAAMSGDEEDVA